VKEGRKEEFCFESKKSKKITLTHVRNIRQLFQGEELTSGFATFIVLDVMFHHLTPLSCIFRRASFPSVASVVVMASTTAGSDNASIDTFLRVMMLDLICSHSYRAGAGHFAGFSRLYALIAPILQNDWLLHQHRLDHSRCPPRTKKVARQHVHMCVWGGGGGGGSLAWGLEQLREAPDP
jgi:hypothetical protein